jgi:hypothetical protein
MPSKIKETKGTSKSVSLSPEVIAQLHIIRDNLKNYTGVNYSYSQLIEHLLSKYNYPI